MGSCLFRARQPVSSRWELFVFLAAGLRIDLMFTAAVEVDRSRDPTRLGVNVSAHIQKASNALPSRDMMRQWEA